MKKRLAFNTVLLFIAIIATAGTAIFINNSTISTIIATLLGSAITFLVNSIYLMLKSMHSPFTGYYRDEIFSNENSNEIIKRDKFELVERDGKILSGRFVRYFPGRGGLTHWHCSGFIVLDQYLLAYRAIDDTTPSRGVILVKLDTTRQNGLYQVYSGKYFKFQGDKIIEHKINLVKIDEVEYNQL